MSDGNIEDRKRLPVGEPVINEAHTNRVINVSLVGNNTYITEAISQMSSELALPVSNSDNSETPLDELQLDEMNSFPIFQIMEWQHGGEVKGEIELGVEEQQLSGPVKRKRVAGRRAQKETIIIRLEKDLSNRFAKFLIYSLSKMYLHDFCPERMKGKTSRSTDWKVKSADKRATRRGQDGTSG
ncbi:hypothetical protein RUM43_013515 [Polyplax serrata]|uniref:Uncharacterized protein n=1 Tax=Polyplax serrata TaxID=468196 RepID=A0AAN8RYF9_POLSC